MYFQLPDSLAASLRISDAVSPEYALYEIPFAQALLAHFDGGVLLHQLVEGRGFAFWQHHIILDQPVELMVYTTRPVLMLHYVLEGSLNIHLHGLEETDIAPRQYALWYVPTGDGHRVRLPAGLTVTFHLDMDPGWLAPFAQEDPVYQPFVESARRSDPNGQQHLPMRITPIVAAVIQALTHCALPEGPRDLFLEARVRDLLLYYLQDQERRAERPAGSPDEVAWTALLDWLQERLDQPLTRRDIAHGMHTSVSVLKRLAHRMGSPGIHHEVLALRLSTAMDLLLTTDLPITTIVSRVTNASVSSFSRSFTQHFGRSPAHYRKQSL